MTSILPNVDGRILTGQLNLGEPGQVEQIGIVGVSTAGSSAAVSIIDRGKLDQLGTLYGNGPLVRAIRDAFQAGAVLAKVLRIETAQNGTAGTADTSSHTGEGTVGFTGNPNDDYDIVLEFVLGGEVGVATFRWSLDSGNTWSDELATAASVTLTGTNLAATFVDGVPAEDSFVAGDEVRLYPKGPAATSTEFNTAIDKFRDQAWNLDGQGPHLILVAGTTGDTVWQACGTKATAFHAAHRYVAFICTARGPTSAETTSEWVEALLAAKTASSDYVGIVAGRIELADFIGYRRECNAAGNYMGRLVQIPASESPARTKADRAFVGPIAGATALRPALAGVGASPIPNISDAEIKALSDAGYLTTRTFFGLRGVYYTDGRMSSSPSSDLAEIDRVRPALEALHAARVATIQELNGDASPAGLRQIEATAQGALNRLVARGRVAGAQVTVDIAQNVVDQGFVGVDIALQFTPKAKWIQLTARWARVLPVAA
ncbi:MAG: hypothetical protein IV100_12595 [Myxococcales bacterium]|uniref:DUF2586 family protein n=1 Tax=Sediminibacterium sp. TaxID=1917865 RepID=UPI001D51461A|nr:DUF2586 family protein [Sediminibacterium sp.]MBT9485838.1 hypothetical protein [Sediminibacterium sp.]MBT9556865.1 hypothetical protein [Myxococcales bacterium]